jgi:hypothetical protein
MVAAPGGAWSLVPEKWRLDPLCVRRRMPTDEIAASPACDATK